MLHQPIPAADRSAGVIPSLERVIASLRITDQVALIQRVTETEAFAGFDFDTTRKLDAVLCEMMQQSIYADHAEDRALHGGEVMA